MNVRYLAGVAFVGISIPIAYAGAQDATDGQAREITLIGCVMKETEFRDLYGPGRSGPRGPGIGGRDEYMLVDAHEVKPGAANTAQASAPCPQVPGAGPVTSYELTGRQERAAGAYVGRRVQLTGIQKDANVRPVGTSGIVRPTGGFDPLGHELHLFEVEVASINEAPVERAEAPAAPAPEPAPAAPAEVAEAAPPAEAPMPEPAAPQAEPAPQVAQAELPRTASPLPVAGLVGLLSLAAAAGLRRIRRRHIGRTLMAAACVLALPGLAAAQYTPAAEPFPIESHWLASGSLGSDFEADAEDPGVNFAGTFGWLWRGVIGGEFQANFSPDFQLAAPFAAPFLAEEPAINSYMLNVIGALPLMAGGQFQPYVSAGGGWFTIDGDPAPGDPNIDLSHTETGWNIGFGAMGFLGQLGVRGDLRYFDVSGDEFRGVDGSVLRSRHGAIVDDQERLIDTNVLPGLSFWRGNVGVAMRW